MRIVFNIFNSRPVETEGGEGGGVGGGGWGLQPPKFLLRLTFYKLKMIVIRKKVAKKHKPLQISRKLLVTLLCSLHVIHKTNFD